MGQKSSCPGALLVWTAPNGRVDVEVVPETIVDNRAHLICMPRAASDGHVAKHIFDRECEVIALTHQHTTTQVQEVLFQWYANVARQPHDHEQIELLLGQAVTGGQP